MTAPGASERPLVLLVDDEESMLKVLERRLQSWGCHVLLAANGPEALRLAQERRPNLILLDVMMPEMDGLEVCRRLRAAQHTRQIPVVLVTVKSTQLSAQEIRSSGAVQVVGKPYDPRELEETVRAALK